MKKTHSDVQEKTGHDFQSGVHNNRGAPTKWQQMKKAMTDARHWAFFKHSDGLLNGMSRRAAEQDESPGSPFKWDTVELPSHVDPKSLDEFLSRSLGSNRTHNTQQQQAKTPDSALRTAGSNVSGNNPAVVANQRR